MTIFISNGEMIYLLNFQSSGNLLVKAGYFVSDWADIRPILYIHCLFYGIASVNPGPSDIFCRGTLNLLFISTWTKSFSPKRV